MTRELISAEEFNTLADKCLSHSTHCPCRHCVRMDELMNAMCVRTYCRKASLPDGWGCEDHPRSPKGAK
jgi:deoxycytidylate deaminase